MLQKSTISSVEGNPLYRTTISRMILSIDGYVLEKVNSNLKDAGSLLTASSDVIVVDLESGPENELFPMLQKLCKPEAVRVIACSQQQDDRLMSKAFAAGFHGYIIKDSTYDEFRAHLILALNGGMPMSRSVIRRLVNVIRRDLPTPNNGHVSEPIVMTCKLIEEVQLSPFSLRQENLSDFLSRRIGLSYHHLSMQFKKEMGMNLSQYVIH